MGSEKKASTGGLEGVVVAETRLSDVDGERGRLIIAGRDVEDLGGKVPFESACELLWSGQLPDEYRLQSIRQSLGQARQAAYQSLSRLGDALSLPDGMEALRASMAHLSTSERASVPEEIALTGAMAVFAAASSRLRSGQQPLPPDPSLGHAADYLRMTRGDLPAAALSQALDTYLVTVIDHGMNASTFTARIVASTGSDVVSAVVAAIGALKGPLHGGAPGPVLEMLQAVGAPERAASWLEDELRAGRRIMGMGHRIYRVRDPRAAVLEKALEQLQRAGVAVQKLQLARAVEREAERILRKRHPDRALSANVEFYTAVLLDAIGLPAASFSATFAVGRVPGWCAHVAEQRARGRLIRPASRYVGPVPA
jgi:citrate synthase